MNISPNKNIYRVFTRTICLVRERVLCDQQPNTNEMEEPTKFKRRAFDYLVYLFKKTLSTKYFGIKRINSVR